jgi:hypothetical protein
MADQRRLELLPYQRCTVDDAWAEASHRGVSRLGLVAKHVTVSWMAATLRLRQHIISWGSLDAPACVRFKSFFRGWKSIGQAVPRRASKLVRQKTNPQTVFQFVYRFGTHALEDWESKLKSVLVSRDTRGDVMANLPRAARLTADS